MYITGIGLHEETHLVNVSLFLMLCFIKRPTAYMMRIVLLTMDGDVASKSLIIVKTLTKWLSFCILRTSSPELKKVLRKAERLLEKIIKLKLI